jgi:hypothetical protein
MAMKYDKQAIGNLQILAMSHILQAERRGHWSTPTQYKNKGNAYSHGAHQLIYIYIPPMYTLVL